MTTQTLLIALVAGFASLQFLSFLVPFPIWITARVSRVKVSLLELFVMKFFRRIPPPQLILAAITAAYAEIPVTVGELQTHHMSGGNVKRVVAALVAAGKAEIELSWKTATCIDLAGRDVLEAVQMSVNPKVIRTSSIEAVSQDGIQIKATCLITVRANLSKLVGSAGEETIVARVGEGIVTAIGKSSNYSLVLEDPSLITQAVQDTGLDSGTAFEILSIDIADVEVGENIGARLQIDQAQADMQVAQAKAEERLAEALARQMEMQAKVEEMRCKVVESQAELPEAIFQALTQGSCSVMEYYKMENMQADTQMREYLSGYRDSLSDPH